ncbi:MAG TPA: sugar transferase [Acidimicrobiales bacterium]|nr:sugar transferase [Acidimicrobiales bacterium]
MSLGLSYQSWVNPRPAELRTRTVAVRERARASTAMKVVAVADAAIVVVVAATAGVPLTWWAWSAMAATVLGLALSGQYQARITLSVARDAGHLLGCTWLPFLLLALLKVHGASTAMLVAVPAIATGAIVAERCVLYFAIRSLRARGWFAERTLFIGAGQIGTKLASTLEEHPEYGLRPVGFLDEVDSAGQLPLFGDVSMLGMVLSEERIDRVIVAFGVTRESDMVEVFRTCEDAAVGIHVLPRFFELATAVNNRNVDEVWGYPLLRLRRSVVRRHARAVKRLFDASVAALALLLVSPLYAALALAVKLSSPGPVHFRQQRVGQRGVTVDVLKFRSMRVNTRSDTEWNPGNNDAVTRIGHVLRVTGLDELPQLWNILRGDMSIVGPRPERPFFVEQFKTEIPRYNDRHRVPVGLTGLAQVHGLRGDTSIDERARLDNQYIENWSLWRDIVIIFQTVTAVFRNMVEPSGATGRADSPVGRVDTPPGCTEIQVLSLETVEVAEVEVVEAPEADVLQAPAGPREATSIP